MKKKLCLYLPALLCVLSIWAKVENEIHSSSLNHRQELYFPSSFDSITLSIDLEDEDGIYLSPQPVAFTIQANTPLKNSNLKLICKITTDDFFPVDSLFFNIKTNTVTYTIQHVSFTPPAAGFYRITIYAESEILKSRVKEINIGYNPEQITSLPDRKSDFIKFWKENLAELSQVAPCYKMTLLKDKCSASKNLYHVEMWSLGNTKIEGYYSVPQKTGRHPAIIRYIGYGAGPRFPDTDALPEFCEFVLSVRGQGIQKTVNQYGDWIVYGLPEKDTYYYRGAYMDLIRGIDFISSRPEVDPENIFAEGASQGGAFTLVACALDKRIKAAAPCLPFLSDFRDYFKRSPWPRSSFEHYLDTHPTENWEKIYHTLSYFDVKNFTELISCPIIMAVGLQDDICPPHTNFAGYNLIKAEKRYYVYPEQKHRVDDNWWSVRDRFFREKRSQRTLQSQEKNDENN